MWEWLAFGLMLAVFAVMGFFRRTPRYRVEFIYVAGHWYTRWICHMIGHSWGPDTHPRLINCLVCDALAEGTRK